MKLSRSILNIMKCFIFLMLASQLDAFIKPNVILQRALKPFVLNSNNISITTIPKIKSFSLDTLETTNKLLQQAKLLRQEAEVLVADNTTNGASFHSELSGVIRGDIKVNKTINPYVNISSTSEENNKSTLVESLLTTRESETNRMKLYKAWNEITAANSNVTEDSELIELFEGLPLNPSPDTYDLSRLPNIEEALKVLPWPIGWLAKFILYNEKDDMQKIYFTSFVLVLQRFLEAEDDNIDVTKARDAIKSKTKELADICLINKPNKQVESSDRDIASMSVDEVLDGLRSYLKERGISDEIDANGDVIRTHLNDYLSTLDTSRATATVTSTTDSSNATIDTNADDGADDDVIRDFGDKLNELMRNLEDETAKDTADRVIAETFDLDSLSSNLVLSRESARRLQNEMLKEIFVVTGVSVKKSGAVVFNGRAVGKNQKWTQSLAERYEKSKFKHEFKYFTLANEVYPEGTGSFEEMALESLTGSSTAVVFFPSTWNSTVTASLRDPVRKLFRSFYIASALVSSGMFAATCFSNVPDPTILDSFIPLAFGPIAIQTLGALAEFAYASFKGFSLSLTLIPSLRLGTWGPRTLYTSMPANQNQLFDTAFIGLATTLAASFAAILLGFDITSHADPSVVANYPSLPFSLLKVNTIISEVFQWKFPGVMTGDSIASGTVHLHWLAISGMLSLVASIFQLIPVDNSAGSKMTFSLIGFESFALLNAFSLFFRLVFLLPFIFNLSSSDADFSRTALLVDFFFASQFAGSPTDNQFAVDNITPLSDGRRTAFLGLFLLFVYSCVPYGDILHDLGQGLESAFQYVRDLATNGESSPLSNTLL